MTFDPTTIALIFALIGAGIYMLIELIKQKEIEIINSVVIFLALYAVFGCYELISAALVGDPNNLPKTWREYLGVAGVVGVGLSLQHIIKTFKKVMAKSGSAEKIP